MALLYGVYFTRRGYRKDYVMLQKHLEGALEKGITVYEPLYLSYEFKEDRALITDADGKTRYFLYADVHYFEETDRSYVIGMKYLPRERRLDGLERALITKRYLGPETERKLRELIRNVTEAYAIRPVLEDHPFK